MRTINIHEAKTHLSRLVEDAAAGDEIVIAKAGRPVARLVALAGQTRARKIGVLKGKLAVPENFDAPLSGDTLRDFGIDPLHQPT
ncbi:MAG: type II toxin-antitoxin system Phd/YefM family antitoxin [Sterolibacteriaceae bacterium]|uniref:Antitoxin n=1 Tax=Candidatus Methylophosphatis roskildensis TaxID=2899263 RepID=A0A9D7HK54_9PROT|nr:type II toxin-antitoxin system Phd/YefM family antitoxin [Candidatus Methylophosphatis roskildensis]MBK7234371.1 type II toxin-antitoxin system Phd/YefM family antitoxin [Sterolibacteriaceae bacterium]